jgi:hypothetical protein
VERFPSDGVFCVFIVFCWFCWHVGHTNVQLRKCTDSCSRPIDWSSNSWLLSLKLHMVVAQLFEFTLAANGSELSSKRVSKLSRRYHCHKKQLRQSAMMAEVSSDAWVCPICLYENQDYQRCMGPDCNTVRPGGQFNTSEFSHSTQPPSSGRRSTISVAMNHPAAAATARRSKTPPPSLTKVSGAHGNITVMSSVNRQPGGCFQTRPPREFTPTPLTPQMSAAVNDSITITAGEDSSCHGGE